jgi:hypothetical protein
MQKSKNIALASKSTTKATGKAAPKSPPAATTSVGTKTQSQVLENLLNQKQAKVRRNKAKEDNVKMRKHLWADLDLKRLWLREDKTRKGYTTLPRTMPLIINLINDVSKHVTTGKSIPAGRSYLVLWCRVFDEGFLKIDSEAAAALEAGYSGERNVTTWREHMAVLQKLGFIDCKEGPTGPFHYILIFNPYQAIKALHAKGWVQQAAYTALFQRSIEIGASDLTE